MPPFITRSQYSMGPPRALSVSHERHETHETHEKEKTGVSCLSCFRVFRAFVSFAAWASRRLGYLLAGPSSTRPGRAAVILPFSNATSPLTITYETPSAYWCGRSKVAR